MGYREQQALAEALLNNNEVKDIFLDGSLEVRYDPHMDEIHLLSVVDLDKSVTIKVNRA